MAEERSVGRCIVQMLGLGGCMYCEIINDEARDVCVHGYSFEPQAKNRQLFDDATTFVAARVMRCVGRTTIIVSVVCPDGVLAFEYDDQPDAE